MTQPHCTTTGSNHSYDIASYQSCINERRLRPAIYGEAEYINHREISSVEYERYVVSKTCDCSSNEILNKSAEQCKKTLIAHLSVTLLEILTATFLTDRYHRWFGSCTVRCSLCYTYFGFVILWNPNFDFAVIVIKMKVCWRLQFICTRLWLRK